MDFLEIFTSGRYHRDMKILKILAFNSKRFRVYGIFKTLQIDDDKGGTPNTTITVFSFYSRKLCFLRSPCLLLIVDSVSLDTSGKPNVVFFLKNSSSSSIILSITLKELNSSD